MKHLTIIFILFLLYLGPVKAQTYEEIIDMPTAEIKAAIDRGTVSERIAVDLYNELAFRYRSKDREEAERLALLADSLAQNINYQKGRSNSQVLFGILSKNKGEYERALIYYDTALAIRQSIKDTIGVISVYNNKANIYRRQFAYKRAINTYQKGLKAIGPNAFPKLRAKLHNNLAETYRINRRFEPALVHLDSSLHIRKILNDTSGLVTTYLAIGTLEYYLKDPATAESNYLRGLSLSKKIQDKTNEAKFYINLGNIKKQQDSLDLALDYFIQASNLGQYMDKDLYIKNDLNIQAILDSFGGSQQYYSLPDSILENSKDQQLNYAQLAKKAYNLGNKYYQIKQFKQAENMYKNALSYLDSFPDLSLSMQAVYNLSQTYYQLKDFENGFVYNNYYNQLRDSLNQRLASGMAIRNQNQNYKNQLLQKENLLLQKENIIQQQKYYRIILISMILLITLIAVYLLDRQRKKIQINGLNTVIKNKETDIIYARLEGIDSERRRVAGALHDGLGSLLSTIRIYFKTIKKQQIQLSPDLQYQFNQTDLLIDKACSEVRQVSHDIENVYSKNFNLKKELEAQVDILRGTKKYNIELDIHNFKEQLDYFLEIKLFRTIQELLNNIIKHAQATDINIQISRFEKRLNIIVEDNGKGFDTNNSGRSTGIGLRNISQRINDLDGQFLIDSRIGRGTVITIDIPIDNKNPNS